MNRLAKLITVPLKLLFAYLYPVGYAKWQGVKFKGTAKIYGNSYYTFGAEPYLISIGDNVHISINVRFVCHDGSVLPFKNYNQTLDVVGKISVGDNVFIGMGAHILQGITVGDNCIIGACSVVTKDIPEGVVVAGNPARIVKTKDEYLKQISKISLGFGEYPRKERAKMYKEHFFKN